MLFAVHIADGVLEPLWCLGGYLLAGCVLWLAARRLHEDELPRVSLWAAVAFVASSIHIPVPPTSVHLLLNGLVGVLLGIRAPLAISVGLLFQVVLLQHGGFQTLGVNTCVLAVPALLCWLVFRGFHRLTCLREPWFRALLVGTSAALWSWCLIFSIAMLRSNSLRAGDDLDVAAPLRMSLSLWSLTICAAAALLVSWLERRLENAPEFPLGLLVGLFGVLVTVGLNGTVLLLGGAYWTTPALLLVVAHLPIAVVEGIVVGSAVGFLCRVKPGLLGMSGNSPGVAAPAASAKVLTDPDSHPLDGPDAKQLQPLLDHASRQVAK